MLVALVEDDDLLARGLRLHLEASGFQVEVFATGAEALNRLARQDLDAVVVDMGLPDMDGIDLIEQARTAGMWAPILVATARAEVAARVRALQVGADDYLVKPFATDEVIARLRALGRRASAPRWAPLSYGDILLNSDKYEVVIAGRTVSLSPRERDLLRLFLRRRGEIVRRDEILAEVFGYKFNPGTNLLDVHIAHLRSKLEGSSVEIRTIRAVGFRLGQHDQAATGHGAS